MPREFSLSKLKTYQKAASGKSQCMFLESKILSISFFKSKQTLLRGAKHINLVTFSKFELNVFLPFL